MFKKQFYLLIIPSKTWLANTGLAGQKWPADDIFVTREIY